MKALDTYNASLNDIYQYFGYEPEWTVYPIEDSRVYFWRINGNEVQFGDAKEQASGGYYVYDIIRIYPAVHHDNAFTMIKVDTHSDGNKFLAIFDNAKKITI